MKVKATRYMRKPFISKGFEVTEDNMDRIARWCKGHVVRDDVPRPFVRVPVSRQINERQTRAYVGTYVIVSMFNGEKSYKVYKKEWLDLSFFELDTWDGDEEDDILPELDDGDETHCCPQLNGDHISIPAQSSIPNPKTVFQYGQSRSTS